MTSCVEIYEYVDRYIYLLIFILEGHILLGIYDLPCPLVEDDVEIIVVEEGREVVESSTVVGSVVVVVIVVVVVDVVDVVVVSVPIKTVITIDNNAY